MSPKKSYKPRKKKTVARKGASMFSMTKAMPIGQTFKYSTRYVDLGISINPGVSGIPATHVFSLNGLFDPNITGTGHQPIGFDQLMPFYDHYCVIGARARCTFINTDDQQSQTVITQLKDNPTVSVLSDEILENGMSKWTTLGTGLSGSCEKTLTINCNTSKFFGNKVMQDEKYRGTVTLNPADQVYLHCQTFGNESGDPAVVVLNIEIEFISILTEPKQLGKS